VYRSAVLIVKTGRMAPRVAVGFSRIDSDAEAALRRLVLDFGFGGTTSDACVFGLLAGAFVLANLSLQIF
jgi:hypothetical protein